MLNRIYIVVGFFTIILLLTAFIAPIFMTWADYRERVEAIASEALGVDVNINGDIDFSLLPLPRMSFSDVIIGEAEKPIVKISSISAKFSLMDFLRDHYVITNLKLSSPKVFLRFDENGQFISRLNIPENFSASNISISDAKIQEGSLEFFDERNGKSWLINNFDGELQLSGLQGPFILDGGLEYQNKQYRLRVNSTAFNEQNGIYLNSFLSSTSDNFTLKLDGIIKASQNIKFDGDVEFRQKIITKDGEQGVRGDRSFKSQVKISNNQILLPDYVFLPDENRPVTRLNGALDVILGAEPFYNLIVSGGIVNLSMPNIIENKKVKTLKFLDILNEMKMPFLPSISGVVGLDISELNYKGLNFKNIRLDANSTEDEWLIDKLKAQAVGKTSLSFSGKIANNNGNPELVGNIKLDNSNLDILAFALNKEYSFLSNIAGSLLGKVRVFDKGLNLSEGEFVFDGVKNDISFNITQNNNSHSLDISANFDELSAKQSNAIAMFIPLKNLTSSFSNTFNSGSFNIKTKKVFFYDLLTQSLAAKGRWQEKNILFENLKVSDFAGVSFELNGGINTKTPTIFGEGSLALKETSHEGAFSQALGKLSLPTSLQQYLYSSLPANLTFSLNEPVENNKQILEFSGTAGIADISSLVIFNDGLLNYATAPLNAELKLISNDPQSFGKQLGFGDLGLVDQSSVMKVGLKIDGSIFNSLDIEISLAGDTEQTKFLGNIFVANANKWKGKGILEMKTNDISPFLERVGVTGFRAGNLSGKANLIFDGTNYFTLEEIDVLMGKTKINGKIKRDVNENEQISFGGNLEVNNLNISGLAKLFGGSSSLISNDGIWADGPFSLTQNIKKSTGRVQIKAPNLFLDNKNIATNSKFDLIWDNNNTRIASFNAQIGDGNVTADISFCCKTSSAEKELKGRVNIFKVNSNLLFPQAISKTLNGEVYIGANFFGFGNSYADIISNLNGEGSFTISNVDIDGFNPLALSILNSEDNILEAENDDLEEKVRASLKKGKFKTNKISGVVNITNGVIRANNIGALEKEAELFGDMQIDLSDLSIKSFWKLSRILTEENFSHTFFAIGANIYGLLSEPKVDFDLSQLIDEIKVQALEEEVKRLEAIQKEALKRQEAARIERERLIELQKQKDAAALIAKQEEERIAAEKLAQQQAAQDAIQPDIQPLTPPPPIDLLPEAFNPPELIFQ